MRIKFLTLTSALLLSASAFAYPGTEALQNRTSYPGDEAMPFMRVCRNPVAAGMAGSGLASTSSVGWASFMNPAAIVFAPEVLNVGASFISWQPKYNPTKGLSLSGSYRLKDFGFTLGFSYVNGRKIGDFTPDEVQFNGGFSYKFTKNISGGGNIRYASHSIYTGQSMSAICGDIYIFAHFGEFNITAGVASVGDKVKTAASSDSYYLPYSAVLAGNWSKTIAKKHSLEANLDLDYYFSEAISAAAGMQYGYKDMVFVRCGYRYGGNSIIPSYASLGLGGKFNGLSINASYVFGSQTLNNSLLIGLGYSF